MKRSARADGLSRGDLGIALGLLIVVLLTYAGTLDHEFVNLDDRTYVVNNPNVNRGLTRDGLAWAWTTNHASNWHPLTWISHMLDCEFFGLDPGGPHAVNVLLHALNAVLLFLVFRRATNERWASALVAALFALHPLRVESVAWVAERKDVLSGLFFMLTLLAYVWYARRPTIGRYVLVLIAAAAGLAAKPMLVTLPFVLLLLDVWPLRRWRLASGEPAAASVPAPTPVRLVMEKLPLVAFAVASSVATLLAQGSERAMGQLESLSLSARLVNAAIAYVAYLWKTLWPAKLAFFYPHASLIAPEQASRRMGLAIGAALLLVGVSVLLWRASTSRRYLAVGWFWYLGMLVPVIGLVQVGSQAMADRYAYLPLIGIYLMLAWILRDTVLSRTPLRQVVVVVVAVVLTVLAVQSWRQTRHWRNTRALAEHALEVTRDNYLAHFLLANELRESRDLAGARGHFQSAIEIVPGYARAHQGLGNVLMDQGDTDGAMASYEEALRLRPDYDVVHYNLGLARARRGEIDAAIAHYESAVRIRSDYAAAHNNLGSLLHRRGDLERAVSHYEAAIRADPDHARAHFNLGLARETQGDLARAEVQYQEGLRIDPEDDSAWVSLCRVLAQVREPESALEVCETAMSRNPEEPGVYASLAHVLDKLGRRDEAVELYRAGQALREGASPR